MVKKRRKTHPVRKDMLREIRGTFGRFMSIMLLCMLAVAFLSGLRTTAPDMRVTADRYFDRTSLMDVRVLSTLGITEGDIDALRALDGVTSAEGNWSLDATAHGADSDAIVKLHAVSGEINTLNLTEGRLPETSGECVTERTLLESLGLEIGGTLTLEPADEEALGREEFTVVGVAVSPYYVSIERGNAAIGNGKVSAFVYLPREDFALDYYTEGFLRLDGADALTAYSSEYDDLIDDFIDKNESFADERAALRSADIRGEAEEKYRDAEREAYEKLADAESELSDARAEIDDGYKELDDAKAELETKLADARAEIAENERKLADAKSEIELGESELRSNTETLDTREAEYRAAVESAADGRAQYEQGLASYNENLAQYTAGQSALDEAKAQLEALEASGQTDVMTLGAIAALRAEIDAREPELAAAKTQLDEAAATLDATAAQLDAADAELSAAAVELSSGRAQLSAASEQLEAARRDYSSGIAQLADAKAELETSEADARAEIAENEQKLADAEVEYQDGYAEYLESKADAEGELADAWADVEAIDDCKWYLLDRNTNVGYAAFSQDAERISNLATVFPVIFFVVAALVCLTTMTRMVEEQRMQIGSLGALGYSPLAISSKYIGYGLFASLLGSVLGLVLGCTLIPIIIFTAWQILYSIPESLYIPVDWAISIISVAAAVVCTVGASVWGSFSALSSTPANLMRPRAPTPGKRVLIERIKPLWNRLGFMAKVTGRNLFRYKKRFFMTIIGIAGCTALMVTGFGLHDSIYDIISTQFDEIFVYQGTVSLKDGISDRQLANLTKSLGGMESLDDYLPARQLTISAANDETSYDVYLCVVDSARSENFINLRHRSDHADVVIPPDGAVITEKLSELLDVGIGDYITLDDDGEARVRVGDIAENYPMHYVYLTPEYYAEAFGKPSQTNSVLLRYADGDDVADELMSEILTLEGVTAVSRVSSLRSSFSDQLSTINYAVVVVITAAAALAFVVLYNLTNINITERVRELATLKVLGFYDGEVSAYIYRENFVLTLFGLALGLVGGYFLHHWLIMTVEIDMLMFGRAARLMNYVWAGVLTVVFSVLVNFAAHLKIKKIDMVESLKSIE